MNIFRCYHSFTSFYYRLVMWIVYPVLAICGIIGVLVLTDYSAYLTALLICVGCLVFEVISDFFIFGGILSKDVSILTYLKTTQKGKKLYASALIVDEIRRFGTLVLFQIANIIVAYILYFAKLSQTTDPELLVEPNFVGEIFATVLFFYFWTLVCIQISRHFTFIAANLLSTYLVAVLGNIVMFYSLKWLPNEWIFMVLLLCGCTIMNIIKHRTAIKKMEDSFYDENL